MSKRLRAISLLAVLLLVTLLASLRVGTPRIDSTFPFSIELPRTVGSWLGNAPLFCQKELCLSVVSDPDEASVSSICPKCGSPLSRISLAELQILPEGTQIGKMTYRWSHYKAAVSVVMTGHERSGIHRPEWCLPSQGLSIQKSRIEMCQVAEGHMLPVSVLTVSSGGRGGVFAYWFADIDHETATHWQRLNWMAYNDLILGVRRPWAYVSIWMPGNSDAASERRLFEFIENLYPSLRPAPSHAEGTVND
jgi:hypothetical protein